MKLSRKIVMIGPVYPYKGGISHYTGLLYRTLAKMHDVTMISYKMQYPKILFKKEQRDYSNDSFKIEDTKYWLNTANPFNIIQVAGKIKKMNPDVIIIQWWHPYFSPCYRILEAALSRYKIIFICHNVFPHERFPMDHILSKMVLKRGSGYIVQSKMDRDDLCSIKQDANYVLTPHPTYNAFKIQNMSKEQAREILGCSSDEKLLLFFGFVRKYKGLCHLLNALPIVLNKQDEIGNVKLMIVGDFGEDKQEYMDLIHKLDIEDSVQLVEGYIPDQEVEKYFAACDLVVLPYESATQSGIVQIAYGFEKTVVVTEVGGLPDVVENGKTGYVVKPQDPEKIAEVIIDFYLNNREAEFEQHIKEAAYRFSWDRMEEAIEQLCNNF